MAKKRSDSDIIKDILLERGCDTAERDKMYRLLYEASLSDDVNIDAALIKECVEAIELIENDEHELSKEKIKTMCQNIDHKYQKWQRRQKYTFYKKALGKIAACFIIAFFGFAVVASAFGYNLVQEIITWGEENFNLSIVREVNETSSGSDSFNTNSNSMAYDDVDKAFENIDPKPLLPKWTPDDFAFKFAEKFTMTNYTKILLYYEDEDKSLIFDYVIYGENFKADRLSYEKDATPIRIFEKNNVKHYIMKNLDKVQVVWTNSNVIHSITGDISMDEAEKILESMYGGV